MFNEQRKALVGWGVKIDNDGLRVECQNAPVCAKIFASARSWTL